MDLKNKRTLITGASKGMGAAIAEKLASEEVKIFLTAREQESLKRLTSNLSQKGADIDFALADLADDLQLERMFTAGIRFLGGIDILVNNAGIGVNSQVADMDVADWDRMFAVNLRAVFLLSKFAAGEMVRQKSGYIINIGSGASQTPIAGYAGYCATKYGLLGFSESLGLELREHNIKVSIIMPGSTATYFGGSSPDDKKASRPGILRPEDVADSVIYLLKQSDIAWTSVMNLRPLSLKKNR
jgi:short-subunit dehydrogenase